ncbi:CHASE domain-containing protein [Hyalangium minutum]|uniref:histidine kinase n=1 Tax=Hyalangium minutum TaxID=394096 RepID=A0A085WJR9_9BACT|nr:CHASE domain-containing protein [Hyalangium minutum]KFE67932.1 sensor histidine kinase [Hyalangium minutum]
MKAALPATTRRASLAPQALLIGSLVVASASTALFLATAQSRDTSRFENQVQATQDRIFAHLSSDIALLRGAAGLFAASTSVTREEFRIYVERLDLRRYDPGLQGLGFAARIPASEQEHWLEQARADGLPSFHIWPAGARDEYYAILYLEPQDARNEAALGFDMFTEPKRREAMERAWMTGEPALSGRVVLKQEIDKDQQAGFLLYVPVYRGGNIPPTEDQRREELEGFVYSPFRAEDLFTGIFPPTHSPRILFRVYDGTEAQAGQLLYDSASAEGEPPPSTPRFVRTSRLEIAGQPWTLVFASSPSFERTLLSPWVPTVGGAGVLLSLMVYAVARSQFIGRQRAEASEAERAQLLTREKAAHAEAEAQRTYLHEVFMTAPAVIGIFRGPEHVFEFANAAYQKVLGNRELLGRPLSEALPDLAPEILAVADTVYQTGQPHSDQEVRIPLAYSAGQREEKYWNLIWQPRRNTAGQVDGVLLYAFEVTEQVLARKLVEASREEARRSAEQLQTITDTLPALVAYVDAQQYYRFANRAYETWFGRKPQEVVGKTIQEFVGEKIYARFQEPILRALAGETVRFEGELPRKDGQKLFIQSSYIPERDEHGQVRGFVVLAFDITERKQAEEAVRNAVRLRDEFLSVASHELKTPLTPLSLKLQTLARDAAAQPDSAFVLKVRTSVEAGLKQLKRLSDLIGDLLDVSRITSGQMKLYWEPVDFAAVVREVATRLEPEAARAESRLMLELPAEVPGRSDRMRLEQVAENLLTNAIKYGAGKPIHVRLEASPERIAFTVKDEGIGIAPENQARIFERFERAVSERNYGGLGLGLYITRTIVEALGGTIRVKSEPGQGACFTVELPREPAVS